MTINQVQLGREHVASPWQRITLLDNSQITSSPFSLLKSSTLQLYCDWNRNVRARRMKDCLGENRAISGGFGFTQSLIHRNWLPRWLDSYLAVSHAIQTSAFWKKTWNFCMKENPKISTEMFFSPQYLLQKQKDRFRCWHRINLQLHS